MEVLGVEVTVCNVLTTLILIWITSILFDWLQNVAWRRKYKLKGAFPIPLFGTLHKNIGKKLDEVDIESVKQYGPVVAGNIGALRFLAVYDLDILKKIFIKDSANFYNRSSSGLDPPPLDKTLLNLKDAHWKRVRSILTPTFSAAKLKLMNAEINYCAKLLTAGLMEQAIEKQPVVSIKHFGCYTMDVIASTAFGIRTDSYNNPEDPFISAAQRAFSTDTFGPWILFLYMFPWLSSFLSKVFGVSFYFPLDSVAFFTNVCKKLIEERQAKGDTERTDLLQMMLNAELQGDADESKKKLSLDEILAQGFLVFIAGYETTSALLMFLSYALATHPDEQDKLIAEIDACVPADLQEVSYDTIMELPYLDQVINETLRMYPPLLRMNRETSQDNDTEIDGYWFPKNTMITYSIWYIHYDMSLYEDPYVFKPERFSPEEKAKRDPAAFMSFGHGHRNCIGMRLALLEAKIAVVHMLRKFKFVKCDETEENLELLKGAFLKPKNPIKVGLELR